MTLLQWFETFLGSSEDPSTPFATPALVITDSIRVIVIVLGAVVIVVVPFAASQAELLGQKIRMYILAIFVFAAVGTEATHFGDIGSWRIVMNTFGTIGAAWGLFSFFRWETPTRYRTSPDPTYVRAELPHTGDGGNDSDDRGNELT